MRQSYSVKFGGCCCKIDKSIRWGDSWKTSREHKAHVPVLSPIPELRIGGFSKTGSNKTACDASPVLSNYSLYDPHEEHSPVRKDSLSLSRMTGLPDERIIGMIVSADEHAHSFIRWRGTPQTSQGAQLVADEQGQQENEDQYPMPSQENHDVGVVNSFTSIEIVRQLLDSHMQKCRKQHKSQEEEIRVLRRLVNSLCARSDLISKQLSSKR